LIICILTVVFPMLLIFIWPLLIVISILWAFTSLQWLIACLFWMQPSLSHYGDLISLYNTYSFPALYQNTFSARITAQAITTEILITLIL
jgi:hypothetical protein